MCWCNPNIRTPFCGKQGCVKPEAPVGAVVGEHPQVHGWLLAFELRCVCGAFQMSNCTIGKVLACRACPRVYQIVDFKWNHETNAIDIIMNMGLRQTEPKIVV